MIALLSAKNNLRCSSMEANQNVIEMDATAGVK